MKTKTSRIRYFSLSVFDACLLLLLISQAAAIAVNAGSGSLAIAGHRQDYDENAGLEPLQRLLVDHEDNTDNIFLFGRFQSPDAVQRALQQGYRRRQGRPNTSASTSSTSKFTFFSGKDGRHGNVSSTKLGGDWVLAESEQLAVNCTTEEVLSAYLSGTLQKRWNQDTVLDCIITECNKKHKNDLLPSSSVAFWRGKQIPQLKKRYQGEPEEAFYRQDLVLRSQRVIRQKTGIMRYSQRIMIDRVGSDRYCVSVRLDPSEKTTPATLKPFESLSVYVHLLPENTNVRIYAAGIMKVNRKVVPNLVVFDASGIAGSMAGKGTLWLAAYFQERQRSASPSSKSPPLPPVVAQ